MADLPNSSVEIVVDAGQAIDYVLSVRFIHSYNYASTSICYHLYWNGEKRKVKVSLFYANTQNAENGISKHLGDRLRKYLPKLRCLKTQSCVDLVKSGNHVYIAVYLYKMNLKMKNTIFTIQFWKSFRLFLSHWMPWKMIFTLRENVIWLWQSKWNPEPRELGFWLRTALTRNT